MVDSRNRLGNHLLHEEPVEFHGILLKKKKDVCETHSVQCVVYSVQCTVYMYNVQCAVHILYNVRCIVYRRDRILVVYMPCIVK